VTTIATGNRRLLKLARLIERRRAYDQSRYAHDCGTPACAWGTAVVNTPRLMKLAASYMKERGHPKRMLEEGILWGANAFSNCNAMDEFAITYAEASELFGNDGCGNAGKNAKKAAAYIREFVKRRKS
jgi:hypothetical protein